jgi:hypothetical protein
MQVTGRSGWGRSDSEVCLWSTTDFTTAAAVITAVAAALVAVSIFVDSDAAETSFAVAGATTTMVVAAAVASTNTTVIADAACFIASRAAPIILFAAFPVLGSAAVRGRSLTGALQGNNQKVCNLWIQLEPRGSTAILKSSVFCKIRIFKKGLWTAKKIWKQHKHIKNNGKIIGLMTANQYKNITRNFDFDLLISMQINIQIICKNMQ